MHRNRKILSAGTCIGLGWLIIMNHLRRHGLCLRISDDRKLGQELSEQLRLLFQLGVHLLHFGCDILQVRLHILDLTANIHGDLMNMAKPVVQLIVGIVLELSVCIQIASDRFKFMLCALHPGLYGHKRLFDILRVIIDCSRCCLVGLHGGQLLLCKLNQRSSKAKEKKKKGPQEKNC